MPFKEIHLHRGFSGGALHIMLLLLAGIFIGALAVHFVSSRDCVLEKLGTPLRPGPWGELYSFPFSISAPEELLPVRAIEDAGTHWFFKGINRAQLERFLNATGVSSSLTASLLATTKEVPGTDTLEMVPSAQEVISVPDHARKQIYQRLAQFPENGSAFFYLHKDTLAERIRADSLSEKTAKLFKKLSVEHEGYLVLGGLPALLAEIPTAGEKSLFLKSLTRQRTMLLRLRVSKDTDLAALAKYWGKGLYEKNVHGILESLSEVPGGTFCSILAILPPIPSAQAYNYPLTNDPRSQSLLLSGDCHSTSLNFFRDSLDPNLNDSANLSREIATSYSPVSGDAAFGDILIMAKPDGEIIHSATLIADDIYFTKNGATSIFPWMFARLPDLLMQYSFLAPEGHQLTLRHYRHRFL